MNDDAKPGLFELTDEERRKALLLFGFFFLVIAAFWIQKPIRTSKFLTVIGLKSLPMARLGVAVAVVPALWLYSGLVQALWRRPRALLVASCAGFFGGGMLAFALALRGAASPAVQVGYFFFLDLYSTVMVALFWSTAHHVSRPDAARRYYGFAGAGGILGGFVGSTLTGWCVKSWGPAPLIALSALLMAPLPFLTAALGPPPPRDDLEHPATWRAALDGARLTLGSPYLLAIAGIVFLYEVTSNMVDYQFNAVSLAAFPGERDLASFLGRMSSGVIAASVVFQALLTNWVLRRKGPAAGLLVLPVMLAVGSVGFLAAPVLAMAGFLFFCDGSLHYSINQTSKEALYTPATETVKYQAKAFIDMLLFRFSKAASALLIAGFNAWLAPAGWPIQTLSAASLGVLALWLWNVRWAGARFQELSAKPV